MKLPRRMRNESDSEYFKRLGAYAKTKMLEVARRREPCIVCGSPIFSIGMFFPCNSARFFSFIGLDQVIVYSVCEKHSQGSTLEIENAILADLDVACRKN